MDHSYNQQYYHHAYDYIRDDTDYHIRATIAFHKYFAGVPDLLQKRVLEYGAGLGKNIFFVPRADGYDPSPYAQSFMKKKNISVVQQVKPNHYDIIALIHSLEHVPEPLALLKMLHTKLKKQGLLLLVLPFETHKLVADFHPDTNNHLYSWNFRAIDNLLHAAGFKVLKNIFLYEGIGYKRFKFLYRRNPLLFYKLTQFLTRVFFRQQRELKILAVKS